MERGFAPWFKMITRYQAFAIRRARRSWVGLVGEDERELPLPVEDEGFWFVDHREGGLALFGELTPLQRDVFYLREVEELSYAEIAERVGSTPGAVRDAQYRATRRLAARRRSLGW